jgi:hypothetical protein
MNRKKHILEKKSLQFWLEKFEEKNTVLDIQVKWGNNIKIYMKEKE